MIFDLYPHSQTLHQLPTPRLNSFQQYKLHMICSFRSFSTLCLDTHTYPSMESAWELFCIHHLCYCYLLRFTQPQIWDIFPS